MLRAVTYNTLFTTCKGSMQAASAEIKRINPDFVGLQECGCPDKITPKVNQGGSRLYKFTQKKPNPILWDSKKFDLVPGSVGSRGVLLSE